MMSDEHGHVKSIPLTNPGPPCLRCQKPTQRQLGKGPHSAKLVCQSCGSWRWAPRPHPKGDPVVLKTPQPLPSDEHFPKCSSCQGWIRPQRHWTPSDPTAYFVCKMCGCIRRKREGQ
jgi:hypothetical protein